MGCGTKFKRRDLNRYRKVYPYLRKRPVLTYISDKEFIIETGEISFTNTDSGTYTFTEVYTSAPTVTAISYDSENNNTANVNVFVDSVSTTSVTIKTSQTFTGKITFQAIMIGCT